MLQNNPFFVSKISKFFISNLDYFCPLLKIYLNKIFKAVMILLTAVTWTTYGTFAEKFHLMRRVLHNPEVVTDHFLSYFTRPLLSFSIIFSLQFHKILEILKALNKMLAFYLFNSI